MTKSKTPPPRRENHQGEHAGSPHDPTEFPEIEAARIQKESSERGPRAKDSDKT